MAAADSPKVPRSGPDKVEGLWDNPAGTDGFEFVEYTAEDTQELDALFRRLGFRAAGRHRSKRVTHYRQGDINFIVNAEPESFAQSFARVHGPSACAMAFRVGDAGAAFDRALSCGAKPHKGHVGPMELNIPAIKGIGDSLVYLVDRYGDHSIYDVDFEPLEGDAEADAGCGLTYIDHLTHNVYRGRMNHWAGFYEKIFNFRELRYFDIEGKLTGLHSRAMTSPCGKIRIPINESADDKSQIEEYLEAYKGEGIQHIALGTDDIYATVESLKARGVEFMAPPPDAYYQGLEARVPGTARTSRACSGTASCWTARRPRTAASCCRSSPSSRSGRSSSRSSSVRATKASARATSRPCSRPWRRTRSAAGVLDSEAS